MNYFKTRTDSGMQRSAIVIRTSAQADGRIGSFLDVLGIEREMLTPATFLSGYAPEIAAGRETQGVLIISGEGLRELKSEANQSQISPASIGRAFAGTLIHSLDSSPACLRAVEDFFRGVKISAQRLASEPLRYRISTSYPAICGALAGLTFESSESAVDSVNVGSGEGLVERLISIGEAGILTYVCHGTQELFVASASEILDLQESASKNIDYRTCFSRVAPTLIALRHLFRASCWTPEAHYGNIIIDDPPLWQRYGHLKLRELADMVDQTGCACTIAMIPWNYRRSNRDAVGLVASRQPRLDVCIHGCNHTGAEFACQDKERLKGMLLTARRRMDAHKRSTNLPHQPVMVFPQGVFSVEAMDCLRSTGYVAAVNTEVADCRGQGNLTLQDLLQTAVLRYGGSPLFTRRRPADGAINFAVDSFLGKPCLVVLHHDFFRGGIKKLEEFVSTLASFRPRLSWDNLENIATHSAVSRREITGRKTVRIFTDRAVIRATEPLTIIKKEKDYTKVRGVKIDNESVDFSFEDGFLRWNLEPKNDRSVSVNIATVADPDVRVTEGSLGDKARIALRRYLCEFRDNYPAQSERLLRGFTGALPLGKA